MFHFLIDLFTRLTLIKL